MDEKTIFYTLCALFVYYKYNEVHIFLNILLESGVGFIEKLLNDLFVNFDNLPDIDVEKIEEKEEIPLIKYEDKFLKDIRKMEKEYIFDEAETLTDQAQCALRPLLQRSTKDVILIFICN